MTYWRNAGLTYLQFSRLAAAVVRQAVREDKKADAIRATSTLKKIASAVKQ
jgi:hypothetical protein